MLLIFPYFWFCVIFFASPTDVPKVITNMLFPIPYNSKSSIPYSILPDFPTIARSTTNTGVEHGDEKIPPQYSRN